MSSQHDSDELQRRLAPLYERRSFGIKPGLDVVTALSGARGGDRA